MRPLIELPASDPQFVFKFVYSSADVGHNFKGRKRCSCTLQGRLHKKPRATNHTCSLTRKCGPTYVPRFVVLCLLHTAAWSAPATCLKHSTPEQLQCSRTHPQKPPGGLGRCTAPRCAPTLVARAIPPPSWPEFAWPGCPAPPQVGTARRPAPPSAAPAAAATADQSPCSSCCARWPAGRRRGGWAAAPPGCRGRTVTSECPLVSSCSRARKGASCGCSLRPCNTRSQLLAGQQARRHKPCLPRSDHAAVAAGSSQNTARAAQRSTHTEWPVQKRTGGTLLSFVCCLSSRRVRRSTTRLLPGALGSSKASRKRLQQGERRAVQGWQCMAVAREERTAASARKRRQGAC